MQLQVSQLTKQYGDQTAVNQISFGLASGEIVGFLGPNGAGKSTTLKILTGYLPATSGTATIGAYNIASDRLQAVQHIGYLAEANPLYVDQYVNEFLTFVGKIYGLKGKKLSSRIEEVIELAGLTNERHKKIENLSKGYKKRVGIAQALIHDPEILILDEPTDGLDVFQVIEIRNLIQSFAGKKTILFSSHILSEVEALASRVIIIHKGNILADDTLSNLNQNLGEEVVIRIEFENNNIPIASLENIKGVSKVEKISHTAFSVHASRKADVRKALYQLSVQNNWALLVLNQEEASLEDLFRKIAIDKKSL